ncbi:MAG: DUF460 domain-containing protein [Desulfurococcales archaeon]|nr:DUF460 domain-containing protein [Desulfurococcales archaeon]
MPRHREPLYMGVDLHYGNPSSARGARYYIAVVRGDGSLAYKAPEASIARLIRVAWELRPRVIAVDNPYELASSRRDLIRILSMLPPESSVVQVNVVDGRQVDVREAARRAGLDPGHGKPSPGKTAYLLAVMASMGHGEPLRIVEEKTLIVISRGRSGAGGGWSQQRFQRRVRASIHQAALRVREALDRAGLEYDYRYRRSEGGLESAVFTVYAPRSRLRGVVRSYRGVDYSIEVKPVYSARVFLDDDARDRLVIVGLDPGISTGLAVIDLKGRILHLASYKGIDRGELIREILVHGSPIIIAADVNPPPEAVRSIAAKLGAEVYTPPQDLTGEEKREIALQGSVKPRDSHQRDALAAAYKAYQALRAKLSRIESYLDSINLDLDVDEVKAEVLRGKTVADAVERQIMKLLEPRDERTADKPRGVDKRRDEAGPEYSSIIEALKAEKRMLEDKIASLQAELERERLNARLAIQSLKLEVLRDGEVKMLRSRVERLEEEVERLRRALEEYKAREHMLKTALEEVASGSMILAGRVKVLSARNLNRIPRGAKVLIVEDPNTFETSAVDRLEELGVRVVLAEGGPLANSLRKRMIPVLDPKDYSTVDMGGVELVDSKVLIDAEEVRRRMVEESRGVDLEKIIREYRSRRAGSIP